jgi:hypothetical protein
MGDRPFARILTAHDKKLENNAPCWIRTQNLNVRAAEESSFGAVYHRSRQLQLNVVVNRHV